MPGIITHIIQMNRFKPVAPAFATGQQIEAHWEGQVPWHGNVFVTFDSRATALHDFHR